MSTSSSDEAPNVPLDQMTVAQLSANFFGQSTVLEDARHIVETQKISGDVFVLMTDQQVDEVFKGQPFGTIMKIKAIIAAFNLSETVRLPTASYADNSHDAAASAATARSNSPSAVLGPNVPLTDRAMVQAVALGLCVVKFSTIHDANHGQIFTIGAPNYGPFHGAWCALTNACNDDFIYLTFPRPVRFHRLETQGRYNADQWVTQLHLDTSDLETSGHGGPQSGPVFEPVLGGNGERALPANTDRHSIVSQYFDGAEGRVARCLKITPTACHGHCSMRFELYVTLLD